MGVKTTARTTSDMIMSGRKLFIHNRYVCGESAVRSFSCHYRHSANTYNILINNVLMKNVKSNSKWEINFCSKQLVILSSIVSIQATLTFRRFLIRRMSPPPVKDLLSRGPTSGFPQGISRNPARNQPDYKRTWKNTRKASGYLSDRRPF